MPTMTVDLIQMAIMAAMLIFSVFILARHLFSSDKSLLLVAGRWLNLWCGSVVLLLFLEAVESAIGSS
jgi:hypothetical protein